MTSTVEEKPTKAELYGRGVRSNTRESRNSSPQVAASSNLSEVVTTGKKRFRDEQHEDEEVERSRKIIREMSDGKNTKYPSSNSADRGPATGDGTKLKAEPNPDIHDRDVRQPPTDGNKDIKKANSISRDSRFRAMSNNGSPNTPASASQNFKRPLIQYGEESDEETGRKKANDDRKQDKQESGSSVQAKSDFILPKMSLEELHQQYVLLLNVNLAISLY